MSQFADLGYHFSFTAAISSAPNDPINLTERLVVIRPLLLYGILLRLAQCQGPARRDPANSSPDGP
jgi:hypothetical protein